MVLAFLDGRASVEKHVLGSIDRNVGVGTVECRFSFQEIHSTAHFAVVESHVELVADPRVEPTV